MNKAIMLSFSRIEAFFNMVATKFNIVVAWTWKTFFFHFANSIWFFIAFETSDWIVRLIGEFSLNISTFLVLVVSIDNVERLCFVKVNLCVMLDISPQWKTSCNNLQCKINKLVSCAWICKVFFILSLVDVLDSYKLRHHYDCQYI
jgi:hypothetical protein